MQKRDATILAEIVGASGDAHHITSPDPDGKGAIIAMNQAIHDAGIKATNIDYINAHGTSTQYNDKIETKAIKNVLEIAMKIYILAPQNR